MIFLKKRGVEVSSISDKNVLAPLAFKMTWRVKAPAAKAHDPRSILVIHTVEGENQLP